MGTAKKRVLIHQIQNSLTNLEDTLDYFRPHYVFLLSSDFYSKDKPDMALMEINHKNIRALGDNVVNIEYSELVTIDNRIGNIAEKESIKYLHKQWNHKLTTKKNKAELLTPGSNAAYKENICVWVHQDPRSEAYLKKLLCIHLSQTVSLLVFFVFRKGK